MRRLAILACAAVLTVPDLARADEPVDDTHYRPSAERRSDFTAGASLGLLVANSYGYLNEAGKLDNPAFVEDTGVGVGSSFAVWIGGALRDWFAFGLGYTSLAYKGNGLDAAGQGGILRVEAFPLWSMGDPFWDLSLYGNFGLAVVKLKRGDETAADGGSMSVVGFGAAWEPLRFGRFAAGPQLEYSRLFSQSLQLQGASAGMRIVFYGGPG